MIAPEVKGTLRAYKRVVRRLREIEESRSLAPKGSGRAVGVDRRAKLAAEERDRLAAKLREMVIEVPE